MPRFLGYSEHGFALYHSGKLRFNCPSLGIFDCPDLESLQAAVEKRYRELEIEYTKAYDL